MKQAELDALLKRNGSTQAKLAKAMDIPVSTVNKWAQRDSVPEGWARYMRLLDAVGSLKEKQ